MLAQMEQFKNEIGPALVNELGEVAKDFKFAIVHFIGTQIYDPEEEDSTTEFKNYRKIWGPKEKLQ